MLKQGAIRFLRFSAGFAAIAIPENPWRLLI
jgi:hypothetical protein